MRLHRALEPPDPNVIAPPFVAFVPPRPTAGLQLAELGVHVIHAPQAGVGEADLVREGAGIVAADALVGAGHAGRLDSAGDR
jgi:hypothetical protein